jgi:hypothetical protein
MLKTNITMTSDGEYIAFEARRQKDQSPRHLPSSRARWRFVSMMVAFLVIMIILSFQLSILWNLQQQEFFFPTAISSKTRLSNQNRAVDVLFGMQGNSQAFIDEWEVALKSILLNAPIDASLHIHILANNAARVAISERIHKAGLEGTRWRNPVTITVYDVEKYQEEWTAFIQQNIRKGNTIDGRVTLGGYYRLLAFKSYLLRSVLLCTWTPTR